MLHPCHTATRPQKTFNFGSGILGDLWSHKRIMVLGAVLFAAARPMFACTGMVYASAGAAGEVDLGEASKLLWAAKGCALGARCRLWRMSLQ